MSAEVLGPLLAAIEYSDDKIAPLKELSLPPASFDAELVSQLMPNTSEPYDEAAATLNELISIGSRSLHEKETTPLEAERTIQARAAFYRKLGWANSRHALSTWYAFERKAHPQGINPGTVTQNIRFIRDLYDGESLTRSIARVTPFLPSRTETLLKEYEHIARLASAAGWDAWDVRRLVQAQPTLLKRSPKTQFFYARAAADHGDDLGLTQDPESFLAPGPFAHTSAHALVARFAGIKTSARPSIGQQEKPGNFLRGLGTEARRARIGAKVMQAYFRAYPVKNEFLLRYKYPYLQRYHGAFMRDWNRPTGFNQVAEILPDEPWLDAVRLPGKIIDIEALNRYAQLGSRKLHNKSRNFKELSAETHRARTNFVEELGWFDPAHRLYGFACWVWEGKRATQTWPSTANMISVIRLLVQHTSDPVGRIKAGSLKLISSRPEVVAGTLGTAKPPSPFPRVNVSIGGPMSDAGANSSSKTAVQAHLDQKQALFAVELSENPLPNTTPLPIQVVQQLPMADRAAVYTAHCLPWLFTTRMIEEGWNDPATVMERLGVRNRAELIKHVATNILPRVRTQIETTELSPDETALEGVRGLLRWLHQEISTK